MSKKLNNFKVQLDESLEELLSWKYPDYSQYRILKKSVDARRKHDVHFLYQLELYAKEEIPVEFEIELKLSKAPPKQPVIIVGTGPAGLFAAIRLLERKIPCVLFERGSSAEKRIMAINRFWRYGELDKNNNVCFGEGGAGLYSDGKLITRIKSPHVPYILNRLVNFGAPKEIEYLSNPHIGSDKIRRLIPKIRYYIQSLGGQFFFDSPVSELLFKNNRVGGVKVADKTYHSQHVILATGHSNSEIFYHLHENNVSLTAKDFAVGVRIEHQQSFINQCQYRQHAEHPKLGSANYKLTYHNKKSDYGVYSFCMCPGGYVLSSGTELNGVVCNGMSNFKRNSSFANSAIVATVNKDIFSNNLFSGLNFRTELEQKAFASLPKGYKANALPSQRVADFIDNRPSTQLLKSSSPSPLVPTNINPLFPKILAERLKQGLSHFEAQIPGFSLGDAQLFGVESRTSCPIRIPREKESLQSESHKGLYPCGEGAGYAGGITSAACDGVKVADAIADIYC